jgi:hypothetical protein
MDFGIFMEFEIRRGGDQASAFREGFDEQILDQRVAVGSAAGLIDRLKGLQEELRLNGVVAELDSGGLISAERVKRTLAILTQEVMPAFK